MQKRPGYESDRFRLVVYDRKSGEIKNLTEDFDQWVETIAWSPDSKSIYFTSENKGEAPIYRLMLPRPLPPDPRRISAIAEITRGMNDDLSVSPDGKTLVFTRLSAQAPNEVYKLDIGSKKAGSTQPPE